MSLPVFTKPDISKKKTSFKKTILKSYVPFGRVFLNTTLLKKGELLIVYESGGPVPCLKNKQKISDTFAHLLTLLVTTAEIDIDTQKLLTPTEAQLFERLMKCSGIGAQLNYTPHVTTLADHIKRYNLLRGGLDAGNHAPDLVQELIQLTNLLSNPAIGRISSQDAIWILDLLGGLRPP